MIKKLLLIYENENCFLKRVFQFVIRSQFLEWYRLVFISNYNYEAKNKDVKECFPNQGVSLIRRIKTEQFVVCVTIPFLNSFITILFIENVPFFSQFSYLPYGPLVKYISEEIDSILDVKHMELVFLANDMEDKRVLWDTA